MASPEEERSAAEGGSSSGLSLEDIRAEEVEEAFEPLVPGSGGPGATASAPEDVLALQEGQQFEKAKEEVQREKLRAEVQQIQAEVDDLAQDTALRRELASKVFYLACLWLSGVALLVSAQGMGRVPLALTDGELVEFHLDQGYFRWVIGGTTASVIGLLLAVLAYLFPRRQKSRPVGQQRG